MSAEPSASDLTLKIGVSRSVGVFWEEGKRIRTIRTARTPEEGSPLLFSLFSGWIKKEPFLGSVFLSSVNPFWTVAIGEYFRDVLSCDVVLFSLKSFPYPVSYRPPASMGSDRLLSVMGAISRFSHLSGQSFAVVDFGSHTTVTVFHKGEVIGGSIAPGIALSLGALGGGRIALGDPHRKISSSTPVFPGNSTEDSIQAGTVLGAVRAVEGLLSQGEDYLGTPLATVLTGGLSLVVRPMFRRLCLLDRHLLHRGSIRLLKG